MTQDRLFPADPYIGRSAGNPVRAWDTAHHRNAQRVADLMVLGYIISPVLDVTWGLGAMWADTKPDVLIGSDLDVSKARDVVADVHALPFRDGAAGTVLFDPPYKMQPSSSEFGAFARHYGHDGDLVNQTALWVSGLGECTRVAQRFVVVKCQDQVDNTRRVRWQTIEVANRAAELGWRVKDMLFLPSESRQPDESQRQFHARRNYSTFVVLERSRTFPG